VRHALRADAVRRLKTERMSLSTDELLGCIAARIDFNGDSVINAGLRTSVTLTRKTLEIFDGSDQAGATPARSSLDAQGAGRQGPTVAPASRLSATARPVMQALHRATCDTEFRHRGLPDDGEDTLNRALNLILATHPKLLRRAERACASGFKEVVETGDWPDDAGCAQRDAEGSAAPCLWRHARWI
jgi:type III restriction enzyme